MSNRDTRLQQFFSSYFNQDWDAGGASSWSSVVDEYLRQNPVADAAAVRDDLRSWLAEGDGRLLTAFGCDYDPRPDGMDQRTWAQAISDYIDTHISN